MTQSFLKPSVIGLIASFSVMAGASVQAQSKTEFEISFSSENAKVGLYQKEKFPEKKQRYGIEYHHSGNKGDLFSGIAEITRAGFEQAPNLDIGFKGKIYFIEPKARALDPGQGLMLGVIANYWLPTGTPAFISAEYLYGPSVFSFGGADDAKEFNFKIEAKLLDTASAYIGYRKIDISMRHKTLNFEDTIHIGFKVAFE